MHNVITYWTRRIGCITTQLQHMDNVEKNSDTFNKGVKCLFTKLLWEAELSYKRAVSSFSPIITNTPAMASVHCPISKAMLMVMIVAMKTVVMIMTVAVVIIKLSLSKHASYYMSTFPHHSVKSIYIPVL